MTFLQIAVLAIIQGLTEFLPVSSSAHLILVSKVFEWPDQGLVLDVAVHLGTLLAVVIYFRQELRQLIQAWLTPDRVAEAASMRTLGLQVLLASIPVVFVGWLAYDVISVAFRELWVIAAATLFFGILLWVADRFCSSTRSIKDMHHYGAFMIGVAQVFALIPGTSRSGVTIMAGRMLGLSADAAARFSFLLSIPVIGLAGGNGLYKVISSETTVEWQSFALAVMLSAIAGWLCIAAFLYLLKRVGLGPFILYRMILGLLLLYWVL